MTEARLNSTQFSSLVEFVVGTVHYAVPTGCVRAVTLPTPLTVLPHLPHGVVGVFEHRGQVSPVMDLRLCFAVDPALHSLRPKWLIVEAERQKIGIVADQVVGVIDLGRGALRPVPHLGAHVDPRSLLGVVPRRGELTFVLDIKSFRNYTRDVKLAFPSPEEVTEGPQ